MAGARTPNGSHDATTLLVRRAVNGDPDGDAVLGNTDLTLAISAAPTGNSGLLYISIGGCTNNVPLVCGAAYLLFSAPFPVFFGAFNLAGSGGACAGSLNMKLGTISPNASLCGAKACIQFGIKCAKGGFGLTNALEISLGG